MPELRWALVALGVAFLAGLGLWEWRRSGRKLGNSRVEHPVIDDLRESERRIEPRIDDMPAAPGSVFPP